MNVNVETSPAGPQSALAVRPRSAVILVAGRGQRLAGSEEAGRPKCMLEIGGLSLLEHQARSLCVVGVQHLELIVGFASEQVIAHAHQLARRYDIEIDYTYNPNYGDTNTLCSLALAAPRIRAGAWCLNGDVLFPSALLRQLYAASDEAVLAVDPHVCGAEEVKVIVDEHNRVEALNKTLSPQLALGESIGVACFQGLAGERFADALECMARTAAARQAYYEAALESIAPHVVLRAVENNVRDTVIEIDFPEDLRRAREQVYPQILRTLEQN